MAEDLRIGPSESFEEVLEWIKGEREYTLNKFGVEADLEHVEEFNIHGLDGGTWFDEQFDNYLHRSKVLNLQTAVGLQALAKFVSTAMGMLSAANQIYGPLPQPGVSSGEIRNSDTPT